MLGRFIQPDTLVPDPGDPQSLNRYSYAANNPVRYTDPSGHWAESLIDIAFIAYDIYDIKTHGLNWENGLSLAADVGGLILPVVTGGGMAVRAAFHADDVAKVASHADEAAKTFSWVSRFSGADDAILRGVRRLENAMKSSKWPPFRYGYEKQLERAYELYQAGKLKGVEVLAENGGRYDFVLMTDEVVEFKYWTLDTATKRQEALIEQILQYHAGGKQKVILEFGMTKTNPVTPEYISGLRKALAEQGVIDIEIRLLQVGSP